MYGSINPTRPCRTIRIWRYEMVWLQFKDVDINDDEWLMPQWYLKDQQKAQPMAKLDVHHALLATTPTVRARNDKNCDGRNYFTIFATDTFARYVGLWPTSFPRSDLERITMCPYRHDMAAGARTNELTQGQPLVFHFAGNDWICACQVLLTDHLSGPHKIHSCPAHYEYWKEKVQRGIVEASRSANTARDVIVLA
jgi:hypothetical protein